MGSAILGMRSIGARSTAAVMAALLVAALAVPTASAETPDAGDTLATAASAVGQTTISGELNPGISEADLYRICVSSGAAFSVSVATGLGNGQLFLFDAQGLGKASNDDAAAGGPAPAFPAGNAVLSALTPGIYYLGLSSFNTDPQSTAGPIFLEASTVKRATR